MKKEYKKKHRIIIESYATKSCSETNVRIFLEDEVEEANCTNSKYIYTPYYYSHYFLHSINLSFYIYKKTVINSIIHTQERVDFRIGRSAWCQALSQNENLYLEAPVRLLHSHPHF